MLFRFACNFVACQYALRCSVRWMELPESLDYDPVQSAMETPNRSSQANSNKWTPCISVPPSVPSPGSFAKAATGTQFSPPIGDLAFGVSTVDERDLEGGVKTDRPQLLEDKVTLGQVEEEFCDYFPHLPVPIVCP